MNELALKEELRALAGEAVQKVGADDRPLNYFKGASAVLDLQRDEIITELPAFEDARAALDVLPMVQL